nr:DNA-binding transcriptional repressor LrhA [Klebsiella pneumoniae]
MCWRRGIYPLILLEEPSPFRRDIIAALETARVSWHLAHGASSLSGVKAAVKAGLGVTARPVEMMSPDLRVAGISEGLPALPDTRYVVSCNPRTVSELPQAIFSL